MRSEVNRPQSFPQFGHVIIEEQRGRLKPKLAPEILGTEVKQPGNSCGTFGFFFGLL